MQVNNFIQYLDHTEQLKTISEGELLPIIKEFPYCQTGQMMYTIQLNANNSILFDEQLKKAASICSDRNKLFEYIHQPETSKIDDPSVGAKVLKELEIKPVKEEMASPRVEITKADKGSVIEKFVPVEGEDELSVLEKEYLTQAVSSSIIIESDAAAEEVSQTNTLEAEKEIDLFDENVTHSFSSWLKHYNGEEEGASSMSQQERNQDIINQFIQEDPRIKPEKTEFYSPTNMARLSVTDAGIVSETLAIIHVDQGNFQEAISTYEKLILKNPKKSSYFAAQIKILKQKIK